MDRGLYLSAAIAITGFAAITQVYMIDPASGAVDWKPFLATVSGIFLAIGLGKLTEYYTSTKYGPVQEVSAASETGAATNILSGTALGMESSTYSAVVIAGAIFVSILIYGSAAADLIHVLYGVALTGIGMLTLTGNTISMDSFGPISDNANGIGTNPRSCPGRCHDRHRW